MRVYLELPEPGTAVTVWALRHPAFRDLLWLGTNRPEPGSVLMVNYGVALDLVWDESMLVKAQITASAWRHVDDPAPRCGVCGFPNDAHAPDCLILLEAQGRVTLKDVTTDYRRQ